MFAAGIVPKPKDRKTTIMKKSFLALAAILLFAPVAVSAQHTVTKTLFEGERITGISASSHFDIVLVKSNQTKAVVEISDSELEPYLDVSLSKDGIVSAGIRDMTQRDRKTFNRVSDGRSRWRLTLHLPTLNTVRLSGFTSLTAQDSFPGENLDILLSGSSEINGKLSVSSSRAKVQCSGFSKLENLILDDTTDLIALISGSSKATIDVSDVANSKIGVSGFSTLRLGGSGIRGQWTVSGSSKLSAGNFTVKDLNLNVSGFSTVYTDVKSAGDDLTVTVAGSAKTYITARGVGLSKFEVSGFSTLDIEGDGSEGRWKVVGSAGVKAQDFALRELNADVSGFSSVLANVSESLTTRTDNSASLRYRGNPRVNNTTNSVRPM